MVFGPVAGQGGRVGVLKGTGPVRAPVLLVAEVGPSMHGQMLVLVELLAAHAATVFAVGRVPSRLVSGHVAWLRPQAREGALIAAFKQEGTLPFGSVRSGGGLSPKEPAVARDVFTLKNTPAGSLSLHLGATLSANDGGWELSGLSAHGEMLFGERCSGNRSA